MNVATNRLTPGGAGTLSYDAAGNQTFDNYSTGTAAVRRLYDAENRLTATQTASSQPVSQYTYDAAGKRMRREVNGVVTWQVYGFDGELVAEYAANAAPSAPQKEYGYRNSELLVTAEPAYQLVARHSGKCLEVGGASPANTAGVYQWGCWGGANQQWRFVPTDSGYSKLVAQHSGKVADVEGVSTANGARIQQYDYLGGANQQWQLVATDSGYYKVVARHSGKVLDVAGVSTADGAQVQQWDYWGGGNQQWQLVPTATVEWLVADQLGTPRMVVDQSGSLASVKRHDYLPFGEEIGAGVGGRTTGQGYVGNADGNRKRWAQLERDDETGLDYAEARYYSSVQGRFIAPDEFTGGPDELYDFVDDAADNPTFYATLTNPQSLNKYQYAYNNPLRFIDPDGHEPDDLLDQDQAQQPLGPVDCAYCTPAEKQKRFDEFKRRTEEERKANQEADDAIGDPRKFDALNPVVPRMEDEKKDEKKQTEEGPRNPNKKEKKAEDKKKRNPNPPGRRLNFNTKKKAQEAATKAGCGPAILCKDKNQPPHYHPNNGKGKPLNHDHYFFPKDRGRPKKIA